MKKSTLNDEIKNDNALGGGEELGGTEALKTKKTGVVASAIVLALALGVVASRNLAYCYQTGYGVSKDLAQAKEYARQERKLQKRRDAEVKRRLETPRPLPGEQASE